MMRRDRALRSACSAPPDARPARGSRAPGAAHAWSDRGPQRRSALLLALALGLAGSALTAAPASAQIAAALGKPLPSPDLPVGTVSVRVVAGSAAAPVVGTDVTLVVNGAPRVARTDSAGRAQFPGLPAGATVVAKVLDEDKAEKASEEFQIPGQGGMRVMITTKPWQGGAGGAPFAGGAGGMPEPRQLSGEVRGEPSDPAGTVTIRVTYNDFKDTPEGVSVSLVGYSSDDKVTCQVMRTDAAGRVQFRDLDISGGTSYFAMAQLPRNGAVDRVTSMPMILDSQAGVRMVLSSDKRDAKSAPIDDFGKADPQVATAAGKVRVHLDGVADLTTNVSLVDAATGKVIGTGKPERGAPDPDRIQAQPQFTADDKLPPGTLDVEIVGGPGRAEEPLPGLDVRVIPANSTDAAAGPASATGPDGKVRVAVQAKGPQKLVLTLHGRQLASPPFELAKSGGKLMIRAQWDDTGRPEALIDTAGTAGGQAVYAEAEFRGNRYRSMPFQLLDGSGSKVTVYVYPRVLFRFQLDAEAEDQLLAVRGRFDISNYSWAPYRAGPDGLVVPLPHGFKGAILAENDQSQVAVAQGEGFRVIRPIPPGGRQFHGAFSLPIESGSLAWTLDLPLGTFQSELVIRQTPGMTVHTQGKMQGETRTVPQGTFYILAPITITEPRSISMTIDGLPSQPGWRRWVEGIIGVLVVIVMLTGVGVALAGRRKAQVASAPADARRQRLLDELVELERTGANPKRRDQLLAELEQLWS